MSYEEYGRFKVGKVAFPLALASSTTKTLLEDGDPGLWALLLFCKAMLETHVGARYAEAAADAALTTAPAVVGSRVPYDPGPYLTVEQLKFPILAAFPVSEEMSEHTRTRHKTDGEFAIQWILPPLRAEQALKLSPMLRLVSRVLYNRIEQGYDPAYESGALVLGSAGLAAITVKSSTIGYIPSPAARGTVDPTKAFYPCIEFSVVLTEVREDVFAETGVEGFDAGVSVKDDAGEQTLVEADIPLDGV
jgi:hypothetical protein